MLARKALIAAAVDRPRKTWTSWIRRESGSTPNARRQFAVKFTLLVFANS